MTLFIVITALIMSGREFHHCNKVRKSQTTNPPRLFRSYLAWRTMEISEGRGGKKNTEELYVSGSEVKYITCLNFTGNIQGKKKKKVLQSKFLSSCF